MIIVDTLGLQDFIEFFKSDNRRELCCGVRVNMLTRIVTIFYGYMDFVNIPFSALPEADFSQPKIAESGRIVSFGDFRVFTKDLIDKHEEKCCVNNCETEISTRLQ